MDTLKHWKIAISQISKCYILNPPLLLLQLGQNLHVGVKDVQKNIFSKMRHQVGLKDVIKLGSQCKYNRILEATRNIIDHLCIPCTKLEFTICQVLHFTTSSYPKSSSWGERCTKKIVFLK